MPTEKKIRPQDRWNAAHGLVSKSYKLQQDIVDNFAAACKQVGVSQAGQLTKMMEDFCKSAD